jgi:L-ascorbate metabolism protein UlaG (beta-lactamase superfamily)
LEYEGTSIALDPFVSWNRKARVLFGQLRPDSSIRSQIAAAMPVPDAILIGHSHYDHAFDLPMLESVTPNAPVLANESLAHTFASDSLAFHFVTMGNAQCWQSVGGEARVWAFASDHVPHLCGTRIAHGHYASPRPQVPSRARHWLDGGNLTYLIDFVNPKTGGVAHRVFYMDGAASAPWGIPPDSILAARPVDVAMISAALWANAGGYPDSLLLCIKPEQVVVVHWDNFMRPRSKPLRQVPLTNVNAFVERCRSLLPDSTSVFLPKPGQTYWLR